MKKAFLQLHIAVFLAGFTGILGRLITLNEGWLVWYRLLLTSVTMWILFGLTGQLKKISFRDMMGLAGLGFLAALHWVGFYGSVKYANVSVALVCFSAIGFFTAVLEPFLLRVRFKWMEILLGILVMAGIYIIFHFDPRYKTGIILGLLSSVFISIVIILLKQYMVRINPETVLTYQLSGGFLVLSAVMPLYHYYFPTHYIFPGWSDWKWLLVLSWLCSVLAFRFSAHALKKLSAFTVNLTFNLEPVYGIILAFIVYRENQLLSRWFFLGFAMIALALVVHVWMVILEHKRVKTHVAH